MKFPITFIIWCALVEYGRSYIQVTPLSSPGASLSHVKTVTDSLLPPSPSAQFKTPCHCSHSSIESLWPMSGLGPPVRATPSQVTLSRVTPSRATSPRATSPRATSPRATSPRATSSRAISSRNQSTKLVTSPPGSHISQTQKASQNALETSITAVYPSTHPTKSSTISANSSTNAGKSLGKEALIGIKLSVVLAMMAFVL